MAADTKDLERRAWRSAFQDGLWDTALGITFLGTGLATTLHLTRGWGYLLYALAVLLSLAVLRIGKQRITIPRLGWVKFGPRGVRRRRNVAIVLVIGVLLMLALIPLATLSRSGRPAFSLTPLLSALAVATLAWTVLSLMAAFWEFSRLYAHAVIIGASFFAVELLGNGWPLLVGPALVLAVGIGCLVRFLKRYSRPAPDALNANP